MTGVPSVYITFLGGTIVIAYVELPYTDGVEVVYVSAPIMAVIMVPSGTVALSNWTVPWKRHGSAGPCAKAMIG